MVNSFYGTHELAKRLGVKEKDILDAISWRQPTNNYMRKIDGSELKHFLTIPETIIILQNHTRSLLLPPNGNAELVYKLYAGHFGNIQLWHYVVKCDHGIYYKTDIEHKDSTQEFLDDIVAYGRSIYKMGNDFREMIESLKSQYGVDIM